MKKEEVGNDNAGEPEHCVGHIALYISLYLKKLVKEEVLLNSPACPHRAHCVGAVRPSGGPGPPLLLFTSSSSSGIAVTFWASLVTEGSAFLSSLKWLGLPFFPLSASIEV